MEANQYAERFDLRVDMLLSAMGPEYHRRAQVWHISILPRHVNPYRAFSKEHDILAEHVLTPIKCNVRGGDMLTPDFGSRLAPIYESQQARGEDMIGAILDDGDDGDYDNDDGDLGVEGYWSDEAYDSVGQDAGDPCAHGMCDTTQALSSPPPFNPTPECYVQAFSHYSYRFSRKKLLVVCDLYGVRTTPSIEGCQGVVELTDPVIHYKSFTGRQKDYGRADLGTEGINKFFETHLCNDVCVLLGLSRENKKCRVPPLRDFNRGGIQHDDQLGQTLGNCTKGECNFNKESGVHHLWYRRMWNTPTNPRSGIQSPTDW